MNRIHVIGLGSGRKQELSLAAISIISRGYPLYFRTLKHPLAPLIYRSSGKARSFDRLYASIGDFGRLYKTITAALISAAMTHGTICYLVPGHPLVGEAVVQNLKKACPRKNIKLSITAGQSFLMPLLDLLDLDLLDGVTVIDALDPDILKEPSRRHLILAQVYSRAIAARVKLKLLELYPPSYPVVVARAAGGAPARLVRLPLNELDHRPIFDHLTSLYLCPFPGYGLGGLVDIMSRLRSETGCPWDRVQTSASLRQYLVEEAYEVIAAIDQGDDTALEEELGDLLLQVVFHSQIAREEGRFDLYGVIDKIASKLIRRHPHVFGDEGGAKLSQVKKRWQEIKSAEHNDDSKKDALSVDHALPSLLRAFKVQKRAAEVGFDWPTAAGPLQKAREELTELEEACRKGDGLQIEEELGDFLFTAVNLARFLKVNPEVALGKTIRKFLTRFDYVCSMAARNNRPLEDYTLLELDKWWDDAKKNEKIGK